jgi:hypothetical protein
MNANTKLTGEEIIEILCDKYEPSNFAWEELEEEDFGEYELVDDVEETSGEAWKIIYFKEHDVYVRINGYYNSYDSCSEFEESDYDVVEPYQAVVTFYESAEEKAERAK